MSEFVDHIRQRVTAALDDLALARATGDVYREQVHTGELESLSRLAAENGVSLPELARFRAA